MEITSNTATKPRSSSLAKALAYYASFIALGLTTASMGPTLPGLAEHTRTHLGEISFLFTARSLGYLFGSLGGGRLYDRFAGHRVVALGLLAMAGMMALVPTIPLLWLLVAVLILLGFAEGMLDVGGNTLLVWVYQEKVGPFMNGLHFFFGVGAFLAPVIIAQAVLASGDIHWAYWILAIMIAPVALWLLRLPSPAMPHSSRDGQSGPVNYRLVVLILLFFFFYVGAETSFGGWVFTYARAKGLGTETTAAYLTSAFWGALTLGRLVAIPIAARLHPRWILLGDVLGCLVSLALVLVGQHSFALTWAGALGAGLFMASVFPTTITLAERYLPTSGRITGFFFVGSSLGSMIFPWVIGQLFEPVGPQSAMWVIFGALVAGLLVYASFMLQVSRSTEKA